MDDSDRKAEINYIFRYHFNAPIMLRFFQLLPLVFLFAFASCAPEKPCSGLNPEIGKFNTARTLRKGRKTVHSKPEKKAVHHREKQVKAKKQKFSAKGKYGGGASGGFHFHIGGHVGGRASGGGSANVQVQRKD